MKNEKQHRIIVYDNLNQKYHNNNDNNNKQKNNMKPRDTNIHNNDIITRFYNDYNWFIFKMQM